MLVGMVQLITCLYILYIDLMQDTSVKARVFSGTGQLRFCSILHPRLSVYFITLCLFSSVDFNYFIIIIIIILYNTIYDSIIWFIEW